MCRVLEPLMDKVKKGKKKKRLRVERVRTLDGHCK
jgi:hypothetical protein